MFDHEGPTLVGVMCDRNVVVFEHLEITSPMDVDKRIAYMQCVLKGSALQKYGGVRRNSLEIIGTSENWQGCLRRISGIVLRRIPWGMTDMHTLLGMSASTLRGSTARPGVRL